MLLYPEVEVCISAVWEPVEYILFEYVSSRRAGTSLVPQQARVDYRLFREFAVVIVLLKIHYLLKKLAETRKVRDFQGVNEYGVLEIRVFLESVLFKPNKEFLCLFRIISVFFIGGESYIEVYLGHFRV